jgi:hypothetical protein
VDSRELVVKVALTEVPRNAGAPAAAAPAAVPAPVAATTTETK